MIMACVTTRTFRNRKTALRWDSSRFVAEVQRVFRAFPLHHACVLGSQRRREEINFRRLVACAKQSRKVLETLLALPRRRVEALFQRVEDGYLQVGMKWLGLLWFLIAREKSTAAEITAARPSLPPFTVSSTGEP